MNNKSKDDKMKFLHGYPYHALGSVTVASLSQNDLSTAVSEYINKAQAAKSSEQLQNAFSQMCQNLGLVSPEYLALMDKNLETLMSLSIPGDTDESVRASNIFNFCMDLVLRLRVANLLIEKNQQELEEKEKDTKKTTY